ncbi:MAG: HAMP domain-containing protein [Acidobacteria bacterium]|nr:MAG: HAMP domain-containing protein [Acidobacteriota bacterium]REK00528.1 MAG: HAMP domain-containing protein [Acidobacteriota bacterium]
MTRFSLRSRVLLGFLGLVTLFGVAVAYNLQVIERLAASQTELAQVRLEATASALDGERLLLSHADLLRRFAVQRDPAYATRAAQQREEVHALLGRLTELTASTELGERAQLIATRWSELAVRSATLDQRVLDGENVGAEVRALDGEIEQLTQELDTWASDVVQSIRERAVLNEERAREAALGSWAGTTLALALALVLTIVVARSITGPLDALADATRELAQGNFRHRVSDPGPEEIARLASDFNQMAERLGQLDQLKRDFVTAISHDLKSPLASMRDTLELVLDGSLGELSAKQRRMLELNLRSNEALSRMIADLLDLARLESGTVVFESQPVLAPDLVSDALERHQTEIERKQLRLVWEARDPVMLCGDGPLLVGALANLIGNAVAHSPDAGTVFLAVKAQGVATPAAGAGASLAVPPSSPDRVCFVVEDQGPGVPAAERSKIFDRFYRAPSQRSGPRGTGLGLTLALSIVRAHDGDIEVGEGRSGGSRFVVQLPTRAAADPGGGETAGELGAGA